MANRDIRGVHDHSIVVSSSGNLYHVHEGAIVIATGYTDPNGLTLGAISEERNTAPAIGNNRFEIDGRVVGYEKGIETFGFNDSVKIGRRGEVSGDYAVFVHGDSTTVTNRGHVVAGFSYGIYNYDCNNIEIRNFGTVTGAFGIVGGNTDDSVIVNEAGGHIYGASVAVGFVSAEGMSDTFVNHGVVRAASGQTAYYGYSQNDMIINDGVLKGDILLSGGNDRVDTRGGKIEGSILGGDGDDTLVTDKADYRLQELVGGGNDTVKSSVSYSLSDNVEILALLGKADIDGTGNNQANVLSGNVGNNRLVGGSGADSLSGHQGDDVLTGNLDDDIFYFATGDGHDTITDFTQTEDRVDLNAWLGVRSFTEVLDHAHDQQDGVLIKAGRDSLLISGLSSSDLTAGDFFFVA